MPSSLDTFVCRPWRSLPAVALLAGLAFACGNDSGDEDPADTNTTDDSASGGIGSSPAAAGNTGTTPGSVTTPGSGTGESTPTPTGNVQPPAGGAADMAAGTPGEGIEPASGSAAEMTFFVTSETNPTGNLGGIADADAKCDRLAQAAGAAEHTWRAYLSAEADGNGQPVNAGERIGSGPWVNRSGATIAESLEALHTMAGSADLFVDENGTKINGQWVGSPTPVQHDVLTGSNADGTVLVGFTCADWTSESADLAARVGHSDGLGPMQDAMPPRNSWNSAHDNGGCNDTAPRGGSGRFYLLRGRLTLPRGRRSEPARLLSKVSSARSVLRQRRGIDRALNRRARPPTAARHTTPR
jgi:hypothetical protein